ncbi:Inner membrane protein CreD [Burkholderiales bacterium]|nr:MAG: cell envelope integrity protein CreD [Burkholderiales bacterium]CAG1005680.1 Inner membrane protein CreD [Burkholderiales bacterium]
MNKTLVWKLLALAVLALVLEFALGHIQGKVRERQTTRDGAVKTIAEHYAKEQQLLGPLLWVKCQETQSETYTTAQGKTARRDVTRDCSHILRPAHLGVQGNMEVSERYRGIYKARVYLAALQLRAQFPALVLKPGQTAQSGILVLGVKDPRGIKRIKVTDTAGNAREPQPGVPNDSFEAGIQLPVSVSTIAAGLALDLEIELAGTGRLDLVPFGSDNDFSLRSNWPHPSFVGQFLPETRAVDGAGFSARWRVNDFATGGERLLASRASSPCLGVSLLDPVDAYTQSNRAVRYGFLFVLLTLGGFLLFELLRAKPLHPLQYALVGFAVVIFFLMLLAFSEHLPFAAAYLIAASACVGLLGTYGRTLLGSWQSAGLLALGYSLLYVCLYQLLASEDYALLLGATLVFAVLALTMYLTRRFDWRAGGTCRDESASPAELPATASQP